MVLFVMVATALAGVLISAVNARGVARHRTVAEQTAIEQVEKVRKYEYDKLGFVSGNPSGTIPVSEASKTVTVSGVKLLVTTAITYVADPTPTSYATSANYKKVVVTVKRASDSKTLTRQVTYVAPPARAPLGGIGNAIVNVQVVDYGSNTPVEGAAVDLATGPSAPRSDATDVTGTVTFPALTPNPVSGATAYYDLSASYSGYVTLSDDVSPGTAAHVQVAPGQTLNTAIRIYRPAELTVEVHRADGSNYPGIGTVTVSSSRGSETFAYSGSDLVLTTLNGEPIVPTLEYTVSAQLGALTPTPVTQYVPDDYPSDLTSTITLAVPDYATLAVTVTQGASPAAGAAVSITGGPDAIDISGTADSNGFIAFDVPAGDGYIASATNLGQGVSQTGVSAPAGLTTPVSLFLMPPVGSIVATVTWAGSPASGKTVKLTGGPSGVNLTGTTERPRAGDVHQSDARVGLRRDGGSDAGIQRLADRLGDGRIDDAGDARAADREPDRERQAKRGQPERRHREADRRADGHHRHSAATDELERKRDVHERPRGLGLHGEGVEVQRLQPEERPEHGGERAVRRNQREHLVHPQHLSAAVIRRRLQSVRGEGGFSIVELLIGFIFIGLLFGLFATVVVSALRHGDEIDEQTTLQVEARAAVDNLAAELRQAYTGDDAVAPIEAVSANTLTFLSPDREQPFHLRRISYRLQSGVLQRAQAKSTDTDGYPWSIGALGGWHSQVGSVVGTSLFTFYDSTGAVTTTPSAVSTVAIAVTVATKTSPNRKYTYRTSVSLRTPLA